MPDIACVDRKRKSTLQRAAPGARRGRGGRAESANGEQAPREEALAATIIDTLADAVVVTDERGKIAFVNTQTEALFGYARDQLLGREVEMLVPERFRDKHAGHRDSYFAAPRVRPMGAGLELYGLRKDGHEFPVEIRLSPLTTKAGVLTSAAIRDVSDRKSQEQRLREAEDRFRGAFESAAIGIALVGPDGRWLQVNRSLCELIGYAEDELLAGGTFQAITHPDDLELDLGYVDRMLAGEIHSYQLDKRYIHKRGHIVWIHLSVSLVRDASAALVHFISQIQDTSQLAAGNTYLDAELAPTLTSGELIALSPLTHREQEVLALVADGLTNEKAAAELGISPETVQSHIRNAMAKLDADSRTQAVANAFRRSLLA